MTTTRLIPAVLVLAALAIGSACGASATETVAANTGPEITSEPAPSILPSVPPPPPATTAPTATAGITVAPTSASTTDQSTTNAPSTTTPATTTPAATTVPPTTAPPTTSAPTTSTPPVDPGPIDAVDVADQSVFGIGIYEAVDVDAVATDVSARLGSPSSDSDWQSMEGQIDCTGSTDFRVLWWGDFRMTFERYQNDEYVRDELSAWTVGDQTQSELVPIDDIPAMSPSDIVTGEGIGLESTRSDLEAVWANIFDSDGDGRLVVIDGGSLSITLDGDQVVGFGKGPFDCPTDEMR